MNKKALKEAARELATRGGKTTLKRHGKEHFINMARIRWVKETGE